MYVTTCIIVLISTYALIKYFFVDTKNKFQNIYNQYSDTDDTDDTGEVGEAGEAGEAGEDEEVDEGDEAQDDGDEMQEDTVPKEDTVETGEKNYLPEDVNDLDLNKKHKDLINTIKSINESYDRQK
jgi:hypothetical protein